LQGMFFARQGADAPRPPRQDRRRHGAGLQFARAGVRDPQARSARHTGARRAHLLRRPDVLVPGRQPTGRGGGARTARHLEGGGFWRPRCDLGGVTFADGAVINLGVSYALPARYPTLGQSDRLELLGTEGTMIIDDDHMEHVLYSEKGIPHAYVPDHQVNLAFLGSNTAGDWALGDFWG